MLGPIHQARDERSEAREQLRLALPLIAGHAGNQLMGLVDTAMVGRLGPTSLGGVGVGNGIYLALTLFGMGMVQGMDAPVSQALGAGEETRARQVLRTGLRIAWLVGLPLTVLLAVIPPFLVHVGVEAGTASEVQRYLLGRLPNTVPFLLFSAARSYLQARGITRPIVVATVVANISNVFGNALLIYGDQALHWVGLPGVGIPALGVLGAGLASSLATISSLLVVASAIQSLPKPPGDLHAADQRALQRTVLRLGLPFGLQVLAEVGAFALTGVFAGRMGALAAAGHQVAMTLASLTFTVTLGISSATAVRVGRHVGQRNERSARHAGKVGLVAAATFMSMASLAFLTIPSLLARMLTNSASVVATACPLLMIAAVFQLSDGTQSVAAGALRGAGDPKAPLYANLVGHYGIGIPIAWVFGFPLGLGPSGLWWGLSAGLTVVAIGLTVRFWVITSRPIARA